MARLVQKDDNGRFALVEDERILGYGHLEVPFIPEGTDQAVLQVRFVMEPRRADVTNEVMMKGAHESTL